MPKGSKPGERRGGRQKGTPNKLTGELKTMILTALDQAGGVDYLVDRARDTPGPFLTLVGKVLPLTVAGDPQAPLQVVQQMSDDQLRTALAGALAELGGHP